MPKFLVMYIQTYCRTASLLSWKDLGKQCPESMTNINLGQFYIKNTQPFGLRILLEVFGDNLLCHKTIKIVMSIDLNGLELNIIWAMYIPWPKNGQWTINQFSIQICSAGFGHDITQSDIFWLKAVIWYPWRNDCLANTNTSIEHIC